MLKIEKFVLPSPDQWMMIIEGMRNPKNSWDRIDSYITYLEDTDTFQLTADEFFMGEKDHKLAFDRLAKGGPVHAKYRRMITVLLTINAPFYWWKEFDTYKVGTVANSCSTMHKLPDKEFELSDFSHDKLLPGSVSILSQTIETLNMNREKYLETDNKEYWYQMIQLLPSSYNQKRTVLLNYEVLTNIYKWRRNHKLEEWHTFCDWIEELPYSELITGIVDGTKNIFN